MYWPLLAPPPSLIPLILETLNINLCISKIYLHSLDLVKVLWQSLSSPLVESVE